MTKTIPAPNVTVDRSNGRIPKDWDGEVCYFCGRPLSANRHHVHFTEANQLVNVNTPTEEVENSQGWFPIGATCAKKVPKGFSTKKLPWE